MKHIPVIALLIPLLLSSCTEISSVLVPPGPKQYGTNDCAVGEARPYPQEVKLAQERLANFIRRANARQRQLLEQHPYVAVQANELVAGEIWPLLRELSSGRVRTLYYVQDQQNQPNYPVQFLLIFDARTRQLVGPDGVLTLDPPRNGSVAEFAGVNAIYAGTGRWGW
ncbi:MAG TPA: hypothetical protein VE641_11245 [Chthoniobacterales bacterium]|nr:hypothetical protein [Chthoniobacterales bacterium]